MRGWQIKAGPNSKRLYGTVSEKRLVTGPYRVVLFAVDVAGNKSAEVRLRFTVDRG